MTLTLAATAAGWPTPPGWWLRQAACIARYESGGDPHNKQNPSSRGLMQFQWATWRAVGGSGDPADATRDEQLYRAWILWNRSGGSWRQWSTARLCGLR